MKTKKHFRIYQKMKKILQNKIFKIRIFKKSKFNYNKNQLQILVILSRIYLFKIQKKINSKEKRYSNRLT